MGTRSLTHIFNNDKEIACMYRQMDGYPSGYGLELASFLLSAKFVNGISDSRKVFNGMGCFAAQLCGHLKQGEAGGIYLYPAGSKDCGEEYVYEIRGGNGGKGFGPLPVTVKCTEVYDDGGKTLYEGDIAGFKAFCEAPQEDE